MLRPRMECWDSFMVLRRAWMCRFGHWWQVSGFPYSFHILDRDGLCFNLREHLEGAILLDKCDAKPHFCPVPLPTKFAIWF